MWGFSYIPFFRSELTSKNESIGVESKKIQLSLVIYSLVKA
jgi:hypothetical protein